MEPLKLNKDIVILEINNFLRVYERDAVNYTVLVFPPLERPSRTVVQNICEEFGLVSVSTKVPQAYIKGLIVGKEELLSPTFQENIQTALATGTYPKNLRQLSSDIVRNEEQKDSRERGIRFMAFGVQGFGSWPDPPRCSTTDLEINLEQSPSASSTATSPVDLLGPLLSEYDNEKSKVKAIFRNLHRYTFLVEHPGTSGDHFLRKQASLKNLIVASIDELQPSQLKSYFERSLCGERVEFSDVSFTKDIIEPTEDQAAHSTLTDRKISSDESNSTLRMGPDSRELEKVADTEVITNIPTAGRSKKRKGKMIPGKQKGCQILKTKDSTTAKIPRRSSAHEVLLASDMEEIMELKATSTSPPSNAPPTISITTIPLNEESADIQEAFAEEERDDVAEKVRKLTNALRNPTCEEIRLLDELAKDLESLRQRSPVPSERKRQNVSSGTSLQVSTPSTETYKGLSNSTLNMCAQEFVPSDPALAEEEAQPSDPALAQEEAWQSEPGLAEEEAQPSDPALAQEEAWQSDPGLAEEEAWQSDPGLAEEEAWQSDPGLAEEEAWQSDPGLAEEEFQQSDPAFSQEEGQYPQEYSCEEFINVAIVDEYAVEGSGMQQNILCPQKIQMEEHVRVCKVPASQMPNWALYADNFNVGFYPQQMAFFPENFNVEGYPQQMPATSIYQNGTTYYATPDNTYVHNTDNAYNTTEYYGTVDGAFVNDTTSVNIPLTPRSYGVPAPAVDPMSIAATSNQTQNMPFVSGYVAPIAMPNSPGFVPCTTPIYTPYTFPTVTTFPANAYDEIPESAAVPLSNLMHMDGNPAQFAPVYEELPYQENDYSSIPVYENVLPEDYFDSDYLQPGMDSSSEEYQRADAPLGSNDYQQGYTYYYGPLVPQQRRTWTRRRLYPLPPDISVFPFRSNVTLFDKETQTEPEHPTHSRNGSSDRAQEDSNKPPSPQRRELPQYFATALQPPGEEPVSSNNKMTSSENSTVELSNDPIANLLQQPQQRQRQQFPRSGVPGRTGYRGFAQNRLPSHNVHSNSQQYIKERGVRNGYSLDNKLDALIYEKYLSKKGSVTHMHIYKSASYDMVRPYALDVDSDNLRTPYPKHTDTEEDTINAAFDASPYMSYGEVPYSSKYFNLDYQYYSTAREKNGFLPQQNSTIAVASTNKKTHRISQSSLNTIIEHIVPNASDVTVKDFPKSNLFVNTVISADSDTRSKDQPPRHEETLSVNLKTPCDHIIGEQITKKANQSVALTLTETLPELAPPPQHQKSSNKVKTLIQMFEEIAKSEDSHDPSASCRNGTDTKIVDIRKNTCMPENVAKNYEEEVVYNIQDQKHTAEDASGGNARPSAFDVSQFDVKNKNPNISYNEEIIYAEEVFPDKKKDTCKPENVEKNYEDKVVFDTQDQQHTAEDASGGNARPSAFDVSQFDVKNKNLNINYNEEIIYAEEVFPDKNKDTCKPENVEKNYEDKIVFDTQDQQHTAEDASGGNARPSAFDVSQFDVKNKNPNINYNEEIIYAEEVFPDKKKDTCKPENVEKNYEDKVVFDTQDQQHRAEDASGGNARPSAFDVSQFDVKNKNPNINYNEEIIYAEEVFPGKKKDTCKPENVEKNYEDKVVFDTQDQQHTAEDARGGNARPSAFDVSRPFALDISIFDLHEDPEIDYSEEETDAEEGFPDNQEGSREGANICVALRLPKNKCRRVPPINTVNENSPSGRQKNKERVHRFILNYDEEAAFPGGDPNERMHGYSLQQVNLDVSHFSTNWFGAIRDDNSIHTAMSKKIQKFFADANVMIPTEDLAPYQGRTMDEIAETLNYVVELHKFDPNMTTRDLLKVFKRFSKNIYLKWLDDTHCLLVLGSAADAESAVQLKHSMVKVRPLTKAGKRVKRFLLTYFHNIYPILD